MDLKDSQYRTLKNKIDFLAKHPDLSLDKIPENKLINKVYFEFLDFLDQAKHDKQFRKKIEYIVKKLHHPSHIIPNTLGSFIFGCNQSDYGDVEKECSILCLSAWNRLNKNSCDNNVLYQKDTNGEDRFIFKSLTDSKNCIIYIDEQFDGFYANEINKLHEKKIDKILIVSTKESKHFKYTDYIPLAMAPKIHIENDEVEKVEFISDQSWIIIFIIGLIIFIIIISIIFARFQKFQRD